MKKRILPVSGIILILLWPNISDQDVFIQSSPIVISCLGDSIKEGYPYSGTDKTYPEKMKNLLEAVHGDGSFNVINHGVFGYRADQVLADLKNLNWMDLDNPALQSFEDTDFSLDLRQRHDDVLTALVESGEIDAGVADGIAAAFEEAIAHIQRQQATCYIALPPVFTPREDLVQQAALLEEMATEGDIDPETVAQAQAALERDIAWLAQFHAGEVPGELDAIEVTQEAAEAARILVELLLGDQGFGDS